MIDIRVISFLHWPLTKQLSKAGRFIRYYEENGYSFNEYFLEQSRVLVKKPCRHNKTRNEDDRIYLQAFNPTIETHEQLKEMFVYMSGKYCLPLSEVVDDSLFQFMDLPNKYDFSLMNIFLVFKDFMRDRGLLNKC